MDVQQFLKAGLVFQIDVANHVKVKVRTICPFPLKTNTRPVLNRFHDCKNELLITPYIIREIKTV